MCYTIPDFFFLFFTLTDHSLQIAFITKILQLLRFNFKRIYWILMPNQNKRQWFTKICKKKKSKKNWAAFGCTNIIGEHLNDETRWQIESQHKSKNTTVYQTNLKAKILIDGIQLIMEILSSKGTCHYLNILKNGFSIVHMLMAKRTPASLILV